MRAELERPARPLTAARYPDVEARAGAVLQALVSSLRDAAGESWAGAVLGGAAAHGEASGADEEPFQVLAVVDVPLREVSLLEKKLRRAVTATARSRRASCRLAVTGRASLPYLSPSLFAAELLAAGHVLDGPEDLLAPARAAAALPLEEGLRLLVGAGARLVEAEREMTRDTEHRRATSGRALRASDDADLALGAAVLIAEGRWVPGERAREEALRGLPPASAGFRSRMTWTRFHDLVEAHRRALLSRTAPRPGEAGEARRRLAQSADRWLEVLRLFEEDRLGEPLPNWEVYARALGAHRPGGRTAGLFDAHDSDEEERPRPTRREARRWPLPERLAPAAGALVDWDPGDLEIAVLLLDLPEDASRDALRARLVSLAEEL